LENGRLEVCIVPADGLRGAPRHRITWINEITEIIAKLFIKAFLVQCFDFCT
jgi:hypothetical protein